MLQGFVIRRMGMGFVAATAGALAASLGVVHLQSPVSLDSARASATTLTCATLQQGNRAGHNLTSGIFKKIHGLACPGHAGSWTVKITNLPLAGQPRVVAVLQRVHGHRHTYAVRLVQNRGFHVLAGDSTVSFQAIRFCKASCSLSQAVPVVTVSLKGPAPLPAPTPVATAAPATP